MSKAFDIKEIRPNIFLFQFSNNYDMCMYFLRYQEFYESSSPKFRGKSFAIFDIMRWYSLKYGNGAFTYTDDWSGFNIPGDTIKKVYDLGIPDINQYDHEMLMAWNKCNAIANGKKFYIISVVRGNKALEHEIAHGLFYLNSEYKKETTKLVKALSPEIRQSINGTLKKLGYTPKVYVDETQAYMATGLIEAFGELNQWSEERKIFENCFKKFLRKTK